jgi:hypothetical protein
MMASVEMCLLGLMIAIIVVFNLVMWFTIQMVARWVG